MADDRPKKDQGHQVGRTMEGKKMKPNCDLKWLRQSRNATHPLTSFDKPE